LPVSLPLVSVALKSCQFRICSKFHMRIKNSETSAFPFDFAQEILSSTEGFASELTLHPRLYTCLDFPVTKLWRLATPLPRQGNFSKIVSQNQLSRVREQSILYSQFTQSTLLLQAKSLFSISSIFSISSSSNLSKSFCLKFIVFFVFPSRK